MTFGYMLLAAAFVLALVVDAKDRSNANMLVVAAVLIALGTFILGVSWHWHGQDYHPDERKPVAEEGRGR